jgi:serine/threonine protein phosphatase PrpC
MTKINFEKEKEKNKDNLLALTDALENSEGSYEAIEYNEIEVDEGDYILLCSDGVYN